MAVNLAAALAAKGMKVGLCDCDLYGPSVALMCGLSDRPSADEEGRILPAEAHGLRLMSMGLLLEEDSPAVLRGPMVTRYTQQFLRNVLWGDLDVLLLDLPPGTGDIQLTIVQTTGGRGDRDHAAGGRPDRCPEGRLHVPEDERSDPWHR